MRQRKRKHHYLDLDDLIDILENGNSVEMKTVLISLAYEIHNLQCIIEDMDNEMRGCDP